jgi:hypothetical protein
MDFSINLGKFSPINPSNTGLYLAYKFLPNHPVTPTYPHSIMFPLMVVSHSLEACILYYVDHSGVSKQEPMAYIPHLSTQATSRSGKFQSGSMHPPPYGPFHTKNSGVSKQEPMAYMPQLSVQATSRSESFRMVYFGYFPYFIYIS